ncbi:hypothetical protein QTA56_03440 [Acinetobacter sp. VNH17]|uniref:Uncharacterized protein n=1 Tax=Acinetobacter thutiue TaxID=2998078 RepID=A0ABT7WL46_9GAMM|nr:hypothetical protein [Acinetobacter thutiue]MCY6411192.1 hypothetical protein [Acinetobacter thutiue]MDN0013294.1 hypothetical protein [Acinetobacter thutiue]
MGIIILNPEQAKGQLTEAIKTQYPNEYSDIIKTVQWTCADELKKKLGTKAIFGVNQISVKAAAELGFSFGEASVDASSVVFIADYLRSITQTDIPELPKELRINNPISSVTWGVGFRIAICVKQLEAHAKMSLGFLSASADLSALDSSFQFASMGMPEETVPEVILNNDGTFKSEQRIALGQWMTKVDKLIINDDEIGQINPLIISAFVEGINPAPPKIQTSEIYALSSISKNLSFNQAQTELKNSEAKLKTINLYSVGDYYKKYMGYPVLGANPGFSETIPEEVLVNGIPLDVWATNYLNELSLITNSLK